MKKWKKNFLKKILNFKDINCKKMKISLLNEIYIFEYRNYVFNKM